MAYARGTHIDYKGYVLKMTGKNKWSVLTKSNKYAGMDYEVVGYGRTIGEARAIVDKEVQG